MLTKRMDPDAARQSSGWAVASLLALLGAALTAEYLL
jgi:hypothetical protein